MCIMFEQDTNSHNAEILSICYYMHKQIEKDTLKLSSGDLSKQTNDITMYTI